MLPASHMDTHGTLLLAHTRPVRVGPNVVGMAMGCVRLREGQCGSGMQMSVIMILLC